MSNVLSNSRRCGVSSCVSTTIARSWSRFARADTGTSETDCANMKIGTAAIAAAMIRGFRRRVNICIFVLCILIAFRSYGDAWVSVIPLLTEEGGRDIKKYCEASFDGADGVVRAAKPYSYAGLTIN